MTNSRQTHPTASDFKAKGPGEFFPFADLRTTGLLWLINTTVFHPRGYALAIKINEQGEAEGWRLLGDGSEPWRFADDCDPEFQAVQALLDNPERT
jgi:hypothetical protein